jgi:hypothetical protein
MRLLLSFLLLIALPAWGAEAWEAFFDPFLGDLRAELDEAKRSGRKGAVIEVLSRPEVQEGYRSDFLRLAIDTRGAQPITGLDSRVLPENVFSNEQKVRATPTFDFYGIDGERLYRHVGGLFDPAEFLLLGRYVASGAYRSLTFLEYRQKQGS